jgi:hypothetical protein
MVRTQLLSLSAPFLFAGAVACSGAVIPLPPDRGTSGDGGSSGSSSGAGSSSGPPSSSGSGSSSGSTGPDCSALPVPSIAQVCPDGSYASGAYVAEGNQCVLTFSCPPVSPPSPPSTTPVPPVCNFALPNICEVCSNGETVCAHYAIINGVCVTEICPPGSSPPPSPPPYPYPPPPPPPPPPPTNGCGPGVACQQGEGCGTAVPAGSNQCGVSCMCDYTGYFVCTKSCPGPGPGPVPGPTGCTQGAPCAPNSGCGGSSSGGCSTSCSCDATGYLQCVTGCPAVDASAP